MEQVIREIIDTLRNIIRPPQPRPVPVPIRVRRASLLSRMPVAALLRVLPSLQRRGSIAHGGSNDEDMG